MSIADVTTRAVAPATGPLAGMKPALPGATVIELKAHVYAGQKVKAEKIPLLVTWTGEDGKRNGFTLELDAAAIGVRPK
jgi:hypothetical protein